MRGCLPFRKPGGELAEQGVRALHREYSDVKMGAAASFGGNNAPIRSVDCDSPDEPCRKC